MNEQLNNIVSYNIESRVFNCGQKATLSLLLPQILCASKLEDQTSK